MLVDLDEIIQYMCIILNLVKKQSRTTDIQYQVLKKYYDSSKQG